MKNLFLATLSLLLLPTIMNSQVNIEKAKYQAILESNFGTFGSGASAIVAKDGKIVYSGTVGMANIELGVPVDSKHVFRIGSITKQFTAVAILLLEKQGKLSLQDEITKFIPDYPTHNKEITVEHLLTHTSGIQSYTNLPEFGNIASKQMSQEEMIDFFKDKPMEFAPGSQYNYNNSGYFLLGYIIEKVSGKSYEDFLQKNIFDKAGMENTFLGNHSRIIPNRAAGYSDDDGTLVNAMHISMDWPYAAGAILSTVGDLLKWNTALHEGRIIGLKTLRKAFKSYQLNDGSSTNYGYGWEITNLFGSPSYEHGGGIQGFLSYGIYLPKEKVYVALLSNCTCKDATFPALKLAQLAIGKTPKSVSSINLGKGAMEEYVGIYQISGGDKRRITLEDEQLYSQRIGPKLKIQAYAKDKFSIEGTLTTFEFVRNEKGQIIKMLAHTRDGKTSAAVRTDEKPMVFEAINLSPEILKKYTGLYEITPDFALDITLKGDQLYLQATNQDKFPLYAKDKTSFFLKIVYAQVSFFKNKDGKYNKLILYQNGKEMPGYKK